MNISFDSEPLTLKNFTPTPGAGMRLCTTLYVLAIRKTPKGLIIIRLLYNSISFKEYAIVRETLGAFDKQIYKN